MSTITVYQIHGKYFLPVSNGVREVSSWQVVEWQSKGLEVHVEEGDHFD